MPVEIVFYLSQEEVDKFLAILKAEKLSIFYVKVAVEYGMIN